MEKARVDVPVEFEKSITPWPFFAPCKAVNRFIEKQHVHFSDICSVQIREKHGIITLNGAKSDFNSTSTLFPFLEKSKNRLKDRDR